MSRDLALAKARRKLTVTATDERVEAAARRRQKPLEEWLRRASKFWLERELKSQLFGKIEKAAGDGLESELAKILATFGIRDASDAGADMAGRLETEWVVRPEFVDKIVRSKEVLAKGLAGESRDRMRRVVRTQITRALREKPQPSVAEIARRIRRWLVSEGAIEFDAMRAARIARTEAAQAQNTGIQEGMAVAGVDEVEWLAHTDGRSGARHHERMNGKRIPMAASRGKDRSKWFKLPSGVRLPYPAWPGGPPGEVISCRCTLLPIIKKGNKSIGGGRKAPSDGVRSGAVYTPRKGDK